MRSPTSDTALSDAAPPSPEPLTRTRAWLVAMAATLVMAVSYVDRQVLAALATSVKSSLHIDHTQYGLLQSAFPIAYLIGAPLSGLLSAITAQRSSARPSSASCGFRSSSSRRTRKRFAPPSRPTLRSRRRRRRRTHGRRASRS